MMRLSQRLAFCHPRTFKKAAQRGRSERKVEAYFLSYVEALSDARTKLEVFFNILLLEAAHRCGLLIHKSGQADACMSLSGAADLIHSHFVTRSSINPPAVSASTHIAFANP